METKMKSTKFSKILILIILILLAYIAYSKINAKMESDKIDAVKIGYQQAIIDLAQNVATCQQVPLIIGNQTINVVAVKCLQEKAATE